MNKNFKKTILLDLDGVLNEYCGDYFENYIPPIKQGAKEFLKKLEKDFKIIIFSTRDSLLIEKWLKENQVTKYIHSVSNIKTPAHVYIDDRCIPFDGDFEKTIYKIENFKPHWKK